jgi:tRNA(Arg) A34 adenosine deaminase TadA
VNGLGPFDHQNLRAAIGVARRAREHGNHPFGAVLVEGFFHTLLQAENTVLTGHDVTGHAELNLVREAVRQFPEDMLARCTLYASTEPCAMCAGAIYWSGIGRVVYALSAAYLYTLAGRPSETLLAGREILSSGARKIEVLGPTLGPEALEVHIGFWSVWE